MFYAVIAGMLIAETPWPATPKQAVVAIIMLALATVLIAFGQKGRR